MDLLQKVALDLGFEFDLYIVHDGLFGRKIAIKSGYQTTQPRKDVNRRVELSKFDGKFEHRNCSIHKGILNLIVYCNFSSIWQKLETRLKAFTNSRNEFKSTRTCNRSTIKGCIAFEGAKSSMEWNYWRSSYWKC